MQCTHDIKYVFNCTDSDFRPMNIMNEIFKSTPNLKEVGYRKGVSYAGVLSPLQHSYHVSAPPIGPYHARSTSYSMSPHHCRLKHFLPSYVLRGIIYVRTYPWDEELSNMF